MKITARGWRRDSGPTTICDSEIQDARPDSRTGWSPDVLYLDRIRGAVEVRIGPATLTLGGRYQVMLRLTDDDINRLFLAIHPELSASLEPIFKPRPHPPLEDAAE